MSGEEVGGTWHHNTYPGVSPAGAPVTVVEFDRRQFMRSTVDSYKEKCGNKDLKMKAAPTRTLLSRSNAIGVRA